MRLINRHPSRSGGLMLLLLPFIVLVAIYFTGSSLRLKVNPDD
jgi:NitT/TauT family transport system permease protein